MRRNNINKNQKKAAKPKNKIIFFKKINNYKEIYFYLLRVNKKIILI